MDGKLLLVTNTPNLSPKSAVDRYKSLTGIERGFRMLKSKIDSKRSINRALPSANELV